MEHLKSTILLFLCCVMIISALDDDVHDNFLPTPTRKNEVRSRARLLRTRRNLQEEDLSADITSTHHQGHEDGTADHILGQSAGFVAGLGFIGTLVAIYVCCDRHRQDCLARPKSKNSPADKDDKEGDDAIMDDGSSLPHMNDISFHLDQLHQESPRSPPRGGVGRIDEQVNEVLEDDDGRERRSMGVPNVVTPSYTPTYSGRHKISTVSSITYSEACAEV